MSPFLWRPVVAGFWKQSERETYSFQDLVDINRVLDFKDENEFRRNEAIALAQERR